MTCIATVATSQSAFCCSAISSSDLRTFPICRFPAALGVVLLPTAYVPHPLLHYPFSPDLFSTFPLVTLPTVTSMAPSSSFNQHHHLPFASVAASVWRSLTFRVAS